MRSTKIRNTLLIVLIVLVFVLIVSMFIFIRRERVELTDYFWPMKESISVSYGSDLNEDAESIIHKVHVNRINRTKNGDIKVLTSETFYNINNEETKLSFEYFISPNLDVIYRTSVTNQWKGRYLEGIILKSPVVVGTKWPTIFTYGHVVKSLGSQEETLEEEHGRTAGICEITSKGEMRVMDDSRRCIKIECAATAPIESTHTTEVDLRENRYFCEGLGYIGQSLDVSSGEEKWIERLVGISPDVENRP